MNSKRINIVSKKEPFTEVRLEDGTLIKLQLVVFGAHQIFNEDNTPKFNDDGSPMYGLNHQLVLFVDKFESVPEGVKRS